MTAFTIMQMSMQEEDRIPELAVQAFRDAFEKASASFPVVYVKDDLLLKHFPTGETEVLKNVSSSYEKLSTSQRVFKRRKQVTA